MILLDRMPQYLLLLFEFLWIQSRILRPTTNKYVTIRKPLGKTSTPCQSRFKQKVVTKKRVSKPSKMMPKGSENPNDEICQHHFFS